ncbi:MAG TPA: carbohydrate kinase, partial [Chloroflexota bacterium]
MTGLGVVPREQAKDPLVLAIDVGTSSARAFVYDAGGRMVAGWGARQPYSAHTTGDGGVEIDGDALADLTKRCVGETLAAMGPEVERLIAVGCDTFWHSLIGVERDHSAATPVYTW